MTDPKNSNQDSPTPPEDAARSMGGGMMVLGFIIFLVLLTAMFGEWESQQYNPNESPGSYKTGQIVNVELQRNRFGHYVSNGTINDREVTFLLDTGATSVAVPGQLAAKLGLQPGRERFTSTANGIAKAYQTRIGSLSIGEIRLYDVQAAILPGMQGDEILLGMSALKQIEFTQSGSTLTLRQYH